MRKMPTKCQYLELPVALNDGVAFLFGHIISDGYIEKNPKSISNYEYRLIYTNTDLGLVSSFKETAQKIFNINIDIKTTKGKYKNYRDVHNITIYSKKLYDYFRSIDYNQILCGGKEIKRKFLWACFDDEGSVSQKGTISISQYKKQYLILIQNLLDNFGIHQTKIKKYLNKNNQKSQFHLILSNKENAIFYQEIGFREEKKNKRLKDYINKMLSKNSERFIKMNWRK